MSTTLTHSHSTCRVFGCLKIYKFGVTFGTDNRFTFATVKPATLAARCVTMAVTACRERGGIISDMSRTVKSSESCVYGRVDSSQAQYQQTLQVLQNIRELCGGQLTLPQICVIGDQSSGKSALLEVTTNIKFPVKSGICTKAPIVVECKHDASLTETQYLIQDRSSLVYKAVPLEELDSHITRIQNEDISKMVSDLTPGQHAPKISHNEIRLQAVGPNQIDIVVVDLPGLINTGAGKDDTRTLVRNHIKHDQTLILLVSEAKQDWELTSAIELAAAVDPNCERTVRVLTKFDTFDSGDARATACDLIKNETPRKLGAHAVICRPSGKDAYSEDTEMQLLRSIEDNDLPAERCGVRSLKVRLPRLFEELITANLPGLKGEIESKLQQANRSLKRVGEHSIDPIAMLTECQDVLIQNFDSLEQDLTSHMETFKEEIHATGKRIDATWCAEKLKPNVFKCPFFQGEPAFIACLDEITCWWKPILGRYVETVDKSLKESFKCIDSSANGVSKSLVTAINAKWSEIRPTIFNGFVDMCEVSLREEKDFGTINHYLQAKYTEDMLLPNTVCDEIIQTFRSASWGDKDESYDQKTRRMKGLVRKVVHDWAEEFGKKTLHKQLERRLLAAVTAAWAVEKKTFTDVVLKKTRDYVLNARKKWVQTQLLVDQDLRDNAIEDASQELRRQEIKRDIEKLCMCKTKIDKILLSDI